jgi:hypothetical protein
MANTSHSFAPVNNRSPADIGLLEQKTTSRAIAQNATNCHQTTCDHAPKHPFSKIAQTPRTARPLEHFAATHEQYSLPL